MRTLGTSGRWYVPDLWGAARNLARGWQRVTQAAGRGYGALDRSVGGILPGGADSPVVGRNAPYWRPRPGYDPRTGERDTSPSLQRDLSRLVHAGASGVAAAQPVVAGAVKQAPAPVRSVVSGALNALPISANLFGRYYTELGAEGLRLPSSYTNDIRRRIEESPLIDKGRLEQAEAKLEEILSSRTPGDKDLKYELANNSLAVNRSVQRMAERGPLVRISGTGTSGGENPLTSVNTSLGSAWFNQMPNGAWKGSDMYDFAYQNRDEAARKAQQLGLTGAVPSSEIFAERVATGQDPLTNFGRAVVSQIKGRPYQYDVYIPPK